MRFLSFSTVSGRNNTSGPTLFQLTLGPGESFGKSGWKEKAITV